MFPSSISISDSVLNQAAATLMMEMEAVQHQGLPPGGRPRGGGPREQGRGGRGQTGLGSGHRGRAVAVMVHGS